MEFKIRKQFADMQTNNNFIKTIEIAKENSIQEILNLICPNGLLTVNMEIVDCNCEKAKEEYSRLNIEINSIREWHKNNCNYKLVLDGYQRIKVSKFWDDVQKDYYMEYLYGNVDWIIDYKHQIEKFLKDDEYCIVYFINKEETFKANRWE